MLIGLCSECNADISLRLYNTNKILQSLIVKSSVSATVLNDLPTWQSVKIKLNNSINSSVSLQIVVVAKHEASNSNPLWEIANVCECPSKGMYNLKFLLFVILYVCMLQYLLITIKTYST